MLSGQGRGGLPAPGRVLRRPREALPLFKRSLAPTPRCRPAPLRPLAQGGGSGRPAREPAPELVVHTTEAVPAPPARQRTQASRCARGPQPRQPLGELAEAAAFSARPLPPPPLPSRAHARYFTLGVFAALGAHYVLSFVSTLPAVRRLVNRFVWWGPFGPSPGGGGDGAQAAGASGGLPAMPTPAEEGESVEWVNMCWRKAWRVYQRGLERWLADLLQPVFDNLVADGMVPAFVQRLRILEFTLDHEAPYFDAMRRRTSRKDSDLNGVVDVRYTGGARLLLLIEVGTGRWRVKIPVLVSDLDLESKVWIKIRLAPMCPYVGTLSLAFLGPPSIKVQLSPYGRVRLMKIPVLQAFLTRLFTIDLPGFMTLPQRLEIAIPPAITAVAEAAVGRDAVMRAVASAVLQADALEHALLAALPLGPQGAAGGVMLPDLFQGELQVTLHEARDLPVWGLPWQSNPYVRMALGGQAVRSRRDADTSHASRHRHPVWNQEFQLLVEDPALQTLEVWVRDSPMTGRTDLGHASFPLTRLLGAEGSTHEAWVSVQSSMPGERATAALKLSLSYKAFEEDSYDSGYREAAALSMVQGGREEITDVKSAADASSRAAVAASAAAAAVAVTKAAAARAAARLARSARLAATGGEPEAAAPATAAGATVALSPLPEEPAQQRQQQLAGGAEQAPAAGASATIEQLGEMASAMERMTADVGALLSGSGGLEAAAAAVAEAEAAAAGAVASGDVEAAATALRKASAALQASRAAAAEAEQPPASAKPGQQQAAGGEEAPTLTAEERALRALAAAEAAFLVASQSASVAHWSEDEGAVAQDGGAPAASGGSFDEDGQASGAQLRRRSAALAAAAAAEGGGGAAAAGPEPGAGAEQGGGAEQQGRRPWWAAVVRWIPGGSVESDAAAAVAAEADGSAAAPLVGGPGGAAAEQQQPWWGGMWPWGGEEQGGQEGWGEAQQAQQRPGSSGRVTPEGPEPLGDIVLSADLPIEEIAFEVQKSWSLRDAQVEALAQKVADVRQRQSERPWLILLSFLSVSTAVLLAIVLFRLQHLH